MQRHLFSKYVSLTHYFASFQAMHEYVAYSATIFIPTNLPLKLSRDAGGSKCVYIIVKKFILNKTGDVGMPLKFLLQLTSPTLYCLLCFNFG